DVEVPYGAFYAYEETLAAFGDPPGIPGSLLSAYERLTDYITEGAVTRLPDMEEKDRLRGRARFERQLAVVHEEAELRHAPEDQVWAEWIEQILRHADVRVHDSWRHPDQTISRSARTLTLLSTVNERVESDMMPGGAYGVYLADIRLLAGYPADASVHVH